MSPLPFKISNENDDDKDHDAGSSQDLFLIQYCVMFRWFHNSWLNGLCYPNYLCKKAFLGYDLVAKTPPICRNKNINGKINSKYRICKVILCTCSLQL